MFIIDSILGIFGYTTIRKKYMVQICDTLIDQDKTITSLKFTMEMDKVNRLGHNLPIYIGELDIYANIDDRNNGSNVINLEDYR